MKIKDEFLQVSPTAPEAVGGARLEPEEQPAAQILLGELPVTLGNPGDQNGVPVARGFKMELNTGTNTVAGLAKADAQQCQNCRHWDRAAWLKMLPELNRDVGGPGGYFLNQVRGFLLSSQNATLTKQHPDAEGDENEMDVESAMSALGICRAYTELFRQLPDEPCVTLPKSSCPATEGATGEPLECLFEHKNEQKRRESEARRDALLKIAKTNQGRK